MIVSGKNVEQTRNRNVGAVDIGSNAVRMICACLTPDRRIEVLEKNRSPIRLGGDVFKQGCISEENIQNLIDNLLLFRRIFEQNQCEEILTYGTSAFREASNQEEVLDRLEKEAGIRPEIISGGEEAQLLLRAVQSLVNLDEGRWMLGDLGGGSLEISIYQKGQIDFAESFRMGTVRLLQTFPYTPEKEKSFLKWGESFIDNFCSFICHRMGQQEVEGLIITGGNAVAIAKLAERYVDDGVKVSNGKYVLEKSTFLKLKKLIFGHDLQARIEKLELAKDRADVILPAFLIFDKLLSVSGKDQLLIPDVGLKDGILDEMMESYLGPQNSTHDEQVIQSAKHYAEKYHASLEHSEIVSNLALEIYDNLCDEPKRNLRERLLLQAAAILHDIGRFIRPSNHHKHSMYLIQNMELVGVTNTERRVISLIARYHSHGIPSDKQRDFLKLSPKKQKQVMRLTAILRLADALDREHKNRIPCIDIECQTGKVILKINQSADTYLASWAVEKKKELFETIFQKQLIVQMI